MTTEFAAAMRRASQEMRASNLVEATRLIQETLGGRQPAAASGSARGAEPSARPRRPLSDTLRTLQDGRLNLGGLGRLPGAAPAGTRPLETPEGARFLARSFACAAGARSYKLYLPASARERPRGLIVMLHGCTQNPDDFALGTGMNAAAEARGFAVAYPAQTRSDNANGCWNWFEPKDQRRDAGEPAIIAGLTREIVSEFGIDPARVFVAGLSAGGAMAAVMGEAYPELYRGVGVHSGLPTGAASDVASAFAAMRGGGKPARPQAPAPRGVRTIVFQGSADHTVHASNADRIVARMTPDAASITTGRIVPPAGGRGATRTLVADPAGEVVVEQWLVEGAGHAWSGGHAGGSYVDPAGPDASAEMMRFFLGETEPTRR